jgi:hypothetical protein
MGMHSAATFRTIGTATTSQSLFVILNTTSAQTVLVRRLVMQMDATAANLSVMTVFRTCRVSTVTGGTAMSKIDWSSASASSAAVQVWGPTATMDGGTAMTIVASANSAIWQQYGMKMNTAVGQVLGIDNNVLSAICETYPIRLAKDEGLHVYLNGASTAANPVTNHYFVQCAWEEI